MVTSASMFKFFHFDFTLSVNDFSIVEFMKDSLKERFPAKPVSYKYQLCATNTDLTAYKQSTLSEKFAKLQEVAKNRVFQVKFKKIGHSVTFSCTFRYACVLQQSTF